MLYVYNINCFYINCYLKYKQQALETGLRDGPPISDEVARLVEYVWREAMGELRDILSVPYRKIGMGKVSIALITIN